MHAKFGVHPGCGCEAPPRAILGAPSDRPVPRNAWDGNFFRFFAKGILGKKLAFFPVLGSFSPSLQRTAESDGGDLVRVMATLSPDDSEFLTAAHRRVVLRAPLEPFFVRARHRAAAVLAAGVHDRWSACC